MRMTRRHGADIGWSVVASIAAMLLSMRFLRLMASSYGGHARAEALALDLAALRREREAQRQAPAERQPGRIEALVLRWWAEALAVTVALAVVAYVLHILTRFALPPSGDSGQWLTIARFYMGESVPTERTISAVPPVVPVVLAFLSTALASSITAIVALAALTYVAMCAVAFALGRRLSGATGGGLLALLLVCVAQEELFQMLAVGAYPHLVALCAMGVALYAVCELAATPDRRSAWWLLTAGVTFTLFSHTPSATLLVPSLGLAMLYVLWSSPDRRALIWTGLRFLAPVGVAWVGFLSLNSDVIFGYASVDAAYDLKGPDRLWSTLWRGESQRIVLLAGAGALLAFPFVERGGRSLKSRPSLVVLLWTAGVATALLMAMLRQANTDYPRFLAYFMLPLGVALAALVQRFATSRGLTLAAAAPILILGAHATLETFDDASLFYGTNRTSDELVAAATWLDAYGTDGGVIAGTREGKWVQALTGRSALINLPRIHITRDWEIERAIDADIVMRANAGLEGGRLLATVNDGGQDYGSTYASGVRVDVYHKGMYTEAFRLDGRATTLTLERDGAIDGVALSSFSRETGVSPGALTTELRSYSGDVEVVRVVSMSDDAPSTVEVDLFIGTRRGVTLHSVDVAQFGAAQQMREGDAFERSRLIAPLFDGTQLPIEMETRWTDGSVRPRGGNPSLSWQKLTMTFTFPEGERRIDTIRTLDAREVLQGYGVRYIVDRDGDGASFPIIRRHALTSVYENEEFRIYDVQ